MSQEKQSEFEFVYSPTGAWAELFKKCAGYAGTELLCDQTNSNRYFLIDRWLTRKDYETFMLQYEDEYKTLSEEHIDLVKSESLIGKWDTIDQ